jgi:hypothetical protein
MTADDRPLTKSEAAALVRNLRKRTGMAPIKRMPAAPFVSQRRLDQEAALAIVSQAIFETKQRCDELERALKSEKVSAK